MPIAKANHSPDIIFGCENVTKHCDQVKFDQLIAMEQLTNPLNRIFEYLTIDDTTVSGMSTTRRDKGDNDKD